MRIILLLLGISITPLAMGDVYRSVDESGNVVFSDKPSPDAEKVEIDEVQTIDPDAAPKFNYTPPQKPQEPGANYTRVEITSPANETTISVNSGNISVKVTIEPGLAAGHKVVLYMDGNSVAEGSGQFTLDNVERGTHTLSAAIVDRNGKEVKRSPASTFTIHRHSIQHKPSTVGKPPP